MDVAIIDYQMSNLHSVQAACERVGLQSTITADPHEILAAKSAILPGVGAFGVAMQHLVNSGLDKVIHHYLDTGKPLIGICLGLQLLFEESEEFGNYKGLGVIQGTVKKFQFTMGNGVRYPVPQVGWNRIKQSRSWQDSLLQENHNGEFMYFVHSYYVKPDKKNVTLATTTYADLDYCSVIQKENLIATQFHPEKSGKSGLKFYEQLKTKIDR